MRASSMRLLAAGAALALAVSAPAKPAEVKVRGLGPLENREMEQALALLLGGATRPQILDASFIEDAALVVASELVEEGFFDARVKATWADAGGVQGHAELDAVLSRPLPRPLAATKLRLEAKPGRRAVVEEVRFEGLDALTPEEAEPFFRPRAGLFTPDRVRAWSDSKAKRGAAQLREALRARGYAEATVEIADTRLDRATGDTRLVVRVNQGPLWRVRGWRADVDAGIALPEGGPEGLIDEVWTPALAQNQAHALRSRYHAGGFADARVAWTAEPGEMISTAERGVVAVAKVEPGAAWRVGAARVEGADRTRAGLLESRVRLRPGAPYDPQEIDAARLRLARLGVFRRVDAAGAPGQNQGERDVVFRVVEEPFWQAAWTLGYGSYEQFRGMVELSRTNLWGLAHRDRIEAGQSLKASRGEYRYTVPTLFNDTVEGSARVFGLRREETSFIRREYGTGVEASREVPWIEARGTAGLSYEVLRADDVALGVAADEVRETAVSTVNLGLTRDRRDNPVRPRDGWRWSARSETALPEIGSEVRYERLEASWSWHRPLGEDRWAHAGVSHGVLVDSGRQVPVNKLFFPGGESSIRGYVEGEAAPRDASGRFAGARSFWLLNLEFEQTITGRWTVVVFSDTLGASVDFEDWPGSEVLSSAGAGLRYQSPIGPVRLEYGRNLNPRERDPLGTLHFSIGFPF